jgi:transposase InsO family protein
MGGQGARSGEATQPELDVSERAELQRLRKEVQQVKMEREYTSEQFRDFCRANGVRPSVGRTGICYDNAVAESFFATLKKELIHTKPWPTIDVLRAAVFEYVESYYNRQRRHSTLGYDTPIGYERKHTLTRLQAA